MIVNQSSQRVNDQLRKAELDELPSNTEAERSVLGAVLLDNSVCTQAIELLKRDDFFLDSHRCLFDKMTELNERDSPIDLLTLGELLRRDGEFERIGGATYISSLIDGVPRTDNIETYAKIIKEKALLRRIIRAAESIQQEALNEGDFEPDEVYLRALQHLDALGESGNLSKQKHSRLLKAEELDRLPSVEWLIENEIPKSSLTVLFGASGAGKSFIALDYALRVAQFEPVVYVAGEGVSGYSARLRAWSEHYHKTVGGLYFYLKAIPMLSATELRGFIREISQVKPLMIVIDTLARCLIGGDENSAKDMGLFVEACSRIQSSIGSTVLVVHHSGKSANGPRGSSALYGAADSIIEVTNEDGLIQVRCEKTKDGAGFDVRYLRLIPSGDSCVPVSSDKVLMSDAKLSDRQRQILECLNLAIFEESGAPYRRILEITKLPSSSLSYSLSLLKQRGFVIQPAKGEPYFITESGKSAIASNEFQSNVKQGKNNEFNGKLKSFQSFQSHSNSISNGCGNASISIPTNSNTPLGVGIVGMEENALAVEVDEGDLMIRFCECGESGIKLTHCDRCGEFLH